MDVYEISTVDLPAYDFWMMIDCISVAKIRQKILQRVFKYSAFLREVFVNVISTVSKEENEPEMLRRADICCRLNPDISETLKFSSTGISYQVINPPSNLKSKSPCMYGYLKMLLLPVWLSPSCFALTVCNRNKTSGISDSV